MYIHYPTKQTVNISRPFTQQSGDVVHFRHAITDGELADFDIYPLVEELETASGSEIEYVLSNGIVTKKTPMPSLADVKSAKFAELGDAREIEEE